MGRKITVGSDVPYEDIGSDWIIDEDDNGELIAKHKPSGTTHTLKSDGTLESPAVSTGDATITNKTLIDSKTDTIVDGNTAGTFTSPSFGIVNKDERNEFASDKFTPDETGWYLFFGRAMTSTSTTAGDPLVSQIYNTTDDSVIVESAREHAAGNYSAFPPLSGIFELTSGKAYQFRVKNEDSSYDINRNNGYLKIRSVFR